MIPMLAENSLNDNRAAVIGRGVNNGGRRVINRRRGSIIIPWPVVRPVIPRPSIIPRSPVVARPPGSTANPKTPATVTAGTAMPSGTFGRHLPVAGLRENFLGAGLRRDGDAGYGNGGENARQ